MTHHQAGKGVPGRGLLGTDRFVATGDGRLLRTMARGSGDDLVVLEAGLGISGLYWGPAQAAIAEGARVAAYERSGFGASTTDAGARDLARLASDLETVIDAYPHRRLVLVGHSWGGPIVRVAAARRLERGRPVAGLVLVDQSDENCPLYFSALSRFTDALQAALLLPLARIRLLGPLTRTAVGTLPEPLRGAVAAASGSPAAARAAAEELRHVVAGLRRLAEAPPRLADTPVSVLSGQRATVLERGLRRAIVCAHRETAAGHPRGRFVPAEASGHLIPLTEPGLVASEALRLLT